MWGSCDHSWLLGHLSLRLGSVGLCWGWLGHLGRGLSGNRSRLLHWSCHLGWLDGCSDLYLSRSFLRYDWLLVLWHCLGWSHWLLQRGLDGRLHVGSSDLLGLLDDSGGGLRHLGQRWVDC